MRWISLTIMAIVAGGCCHHEKTIAPPSPVANCPTGCGTVQYPPSSTPIAPTLPLAPPAR